MAGKRFRAEQIIMKLREAGVGLAQGQRVGQVLKQMGVSEQTYYRWRKEWCFIRELLLTFSLSSTTCNSAWVSRGFSVIKHV